MSRIIYGLSFASQSPVYILCMLSNPQSPANSSFCVLHRTHIWCILTMSRIMCGISVACQSPVYILCVSYMSQSPTNSSYYLPLYNSYLVCPNYVLNHLRIILCISIYSLHFMHPILVTIPIEFFILRPTRNSYLVRPNCVMDFPFLPNLAFIFVTRILSMSQILCLLFFADKIQSVY